MSIKTNENECVPAASDGYEPIDEVLKALLIKRAEQTADIDRMQQHIFYEPDAGLIADALGFSPLVDPKTGCTYLTEGFRPFWAVQQHPGWFEMTVRFGADFVAFTFVLFIKDCDSADPAFRAACREFAGAPEPWKTGTLNGSPDAGRAGEL